MKVININQGINCDTIIFPDKQPHINISGIVEGDDVKVVCSIVDANHLLWLLECANAIDAVYANKQELVIPYLMGARYDRKMQWGDSFDLKVIANLINGCGFKKVVLFDPHSDVSMGLINNSDSITNRHLIKFYNQQDAVLICPDAGASKKVDKYLKSNSNIKDVVYCNKSRNLTNGNITLKVLEPEKCQGRNCVIIDDLCDGGGTFLAIASQIKAKHLTLIVSHGIFSRGLGVFEGIFDKIIVSDSYASYKHPLVTQVNLIL